MDYDEAREKAIKELRFNIGNLPYIKEEKAEKDSSKYVFPIFYKKPIPGKQVRFSEERQVGKIEVKEGGDIERTSNEKIRENIIKIKEKIQEGQVPIE